jgi:hypothetical protein
MSDLGTQTEGGQTLSYAAGVPEQPRLSRLAIASLVVAIVLSPCVLGPILSASEPLLRRHGLEVSLRLRLLTSMVASALSIAAMIRVRLSNRTRTGVAVAGWAFAISLLWWALLGFLFLAWPRLY